MNGPGDKPLALRLRLPYFDAASFVERHAGLCQAGLIFLPTRQHLEAGEVVRFELLTRTGTRLILAEGEVTVPERVPARPGVFVRVHRLDPASRELYERLWSDASVSRPGSLEDALREASERTGDAEPASAEEGREAIAEAPPAPPPSPPNAWALDAPASDALESEAPESEVPAPDAPAPEAPAADAPAPDPALAALLRPIHAAGRRALVGLDLGTTRTRSALAGEAGTHPFLLEDHGELPTAFGLHEDGSTLLGTAALAYRGQRPGRVAFHAKRLLGRSPQWPTAQAYASRLPWPVGLDETGGTALALVDFPTPLITGHARLLQAARRRVEGRLGASLAGAVVSVPGWFGPGQRGAVREAARQAGFEAVHLLDAGLAAAIAYGWGRGLAGKRLAVWHLGGGGFDVAVVTVAGERYEVDALRSDPGLGGLDFDARVLEHLLAVVDEAGGRALLDDRAMVRLADAAEAARIALSEAEHHTVRLPELWRSGSTGGGIEVELTRRELEGWTRGLVARAVSLTHEALAELGLSPDRIDALLLVGGPAGMPLVRAQAEAVFGRPPAADLDPLQAVAQGCAIAGAALAMAGLPGALPLRLRSRLSRSVSLALPDGRLVPLVEAGTPYPCERTVRFGPAERDQDALVVALLEGEGDTVERAEHHSMLRFASPSPDRPIRLAVAVDEEGVLALRAVDDASGAALTWSQPIPESREALLERLQASPARFQDLGLPARPGSRRGGGLLRRLRRLLGGA